MRGGNSDSCFVLKNVSLVEFKLVPLKFLRLKLLVVYGIAVIPIFGFVKLSKFFKKMTRVCCMTFPRYTIKSEKNTTDFFLLPFSFLVVL